MTAFTTLRDGGLSVKIAGVERRDVVRGLEWESVGAGPMGDAGASFWIEVADPFNPQAQYPELLHGAKVVVEHTLDSTTTRLYTGYVLTDPRAGYAGDRAIVNVQCGGAIEVAKSRGDLAFTWTDPDTSQWIVNKRSPKCYSFNTSGEITITAADESKARYDRAGIVGAVCCLGATHMLDAATGWRRITGTITYDLHDHLRAALIWAPVYKASHDVSDYSVIHAWGPNVKAKNKKIDYTFGGTAGAGYVALAMWCNKRGGKKLTDEREVSIDDLVLYTSTTERRLDQAMLDVADLVGLHSSQDVQQFSTAGTTGSVSRSVLVRPHTDASSALSSLAAQASAIVEWGWLGDQFICRPLETDPAAIRALSNCYLVDPEDPGVDWDVTQHPEDGEPLAIRLVYGHSSKSIWPAGSPATVVAPADPGWAVGTPFQGTTCPVETVDFSSRNFTAAGAKKLAKLLAQHLGIGLSGGQNLQLTVPTIPVYGGGTRPVPYIHGGDWIESSRGGAGPLYITRAHVSADTGYVDYDVGIAQDVLIDQLQAAGGATALKLHKAKRRKRR